MSDRRRQREQGLVVWCAATLDRITSNDTSARLLLVLAAGLLLPGCFSGESSVPHQVLLSVTLALQAAKNLKFSRGDVTKAEREGELKLPEVLEERLSHDRHKGFFAYRRAEVLGLAHSDWVAEASHTTLINRVTDDFDEVVAFELEVFTERRLDQIAPDGPTPQASDGSFRCDGDKHLDLADVARMTVTEGPASTFLVEGYLQMRKSNVKSIIWRAAALHAELWNEAASSNRLRKASLLELIDRRLRLVERAAFQLNGGVEAPLKRAAGGGERGPWLDTTRIRMFEYPFRSSKSPVELRDLLGPTPERFWSVRHKISGDATSPIVFIDYTKNFGTAAQPRMVSTRFNPEPDSISAVWNPPIGRAYSRTFVPTADTLTGAIDTIMLAATDYWDRNWLYCDHACDLLQLDALRFALKRSTTSDTMFNGIPGQKPVILFPPLARIPDDFTNPQVPDRQALFADGADAVWFDNSYVRPEKFQVGDQIVFWNHRLYLAISSGAFRLENAILSRVESDPLVGGMRLVDLGMEGHGMTSLSRDKGIFERRPGIAAYTIDMNGSMNRGFNSLRKHANDYEIGAFTKFVANGGGERFAVIRWKPYDDLDNGSTTGPWFVFIPRVRNEYEYWSSVDSMLRNIHYSVLEDPDPGDDYQEPNDGEDTIEITNENGDVETFDLDDGVLFPLHRPKVFGTSKILSWQEYFALRRKTPGLDFVLSEFDLVRPNIEDLKRERAKNPDVNPPIDELTGDMPGMFFGGDRTLPVQALRPKVRV
jgi:hypothetical protein